MSESVHTSTWRSEVDALSFHPEGHDGLCVVHRYAFRTLMGFLPEPKECERFFRVHRASFEAAARAKIDRRALNRDANFHLTSRDVVREMVSPS